MINISKSIHLFNYIILPNRKNIMMKLWKTFNELGDFL